MSAHSPVMVHMTLTEARALASWLDLVAIIERADWNGERSLTRHRLQSIEKRLGESIRRAQDLEQEKQDEEES
jgi:hypothetical protein